MRQNTWYDWLIYYLPHPIRKIAGRFKIKLHVFLRQTHPEKTLYERQKKLSKPKSQKQSEENVIKKIRSLFILNKEIKEVKDKIEVLGHFLNKKLIIINQ